MYKAVEELRNKQEETNQIGLLNQQNSQQLKQSADDIMKEIEELIKKFADAAAYARQCGFGNRQPFIELCHSFFNSDLIFYFLRRIL